MNIGLYFGSFNPVHIGHMAIANYMLEFTDLDRIWFVVSPHNPEKNKENLLADHHRLEMVTLAIGENHKMKSSNIEFGLSQPNYTVKTLAALEEKYPDKTFSLIIGGDNLCTFHKWKNFEHILEHYKLYVYPRKGSIKKPKIDLSSVIKVDAPLIEVSSSLIRNSIKEGKDMRYFLHDKVAEYVAEMHFYKK